MFTRNFLIYISLLNMGTSFNLLLPVSAQSSRQPIERKEQRLTDSKPVEGGWDVLKDVTINGRIFDIAGVMHANYGFIGKAVFANRDGYATFEAWVGFRGGRGGSEGTQQFVVFGDGKELYRSAKMQENDPSVHIRVCKSISSRFVRRGVIYHARVAGS